MPNNNHNEHIESAYERDVDIHQVHYLEVPGLTHDHLEYGEQRATKMVEVSDTEIHIGLFVKTFSCEIYSNILFDVSTDLIVRASKTTQVKSRAGSLY